MSIKSLLQLILLSLMIIIIGGIYFLYFYSGPLKSRSNINLNTNENEIKEELNLDNQDILETKDLSENKENIDQSNMNNQNKLKNIKEAPKIDDDKLSNISSSNEKSLTKEIEYITTNNKGDIFKILAKYGRTNLEDKNILDLEKVKGTISSKKRSTINIESDFANYNHKNQNSKFYKNVKINHDNRVIFCDSFYLDQSKSLATAFGNVVVKDNTSVMKAKVVTMNIITKEIKINSEENINIITD